MCEIVSKSPWSISFNWSAGAQAALLFERLSFGRSCPNQLNKGRSKNFRENGWMGSWRTPFQKYSLFSLLSESMSTNTSFISSTLSNILSNSRGHKCSYGLKKWKSTPGRFFRPNLLTLLKTTLTKLAFVSSSRWLATTPARCSPARRSKAPRRSNGWRWWQWRRRRMRSWAPRAGWCRADLSRASIADRRSEDETESFAFLQLQASKQFIKNMMR